MSSFMGPPPEKPSDEPNADDRTWGMMAHLSSLLAMALGGMAFLGPLLVWVIKKDQSPFVGDQAKEALNFHLAVLIAILICTATCILSPLVLVIVVAAIVYPIIGGLAANKGEYYRYPYTIRLIK